MGYKDDPVKIDKTLLNYSAQAIRDLSTIIPDNFNINGTMLEGFLGLLNNCVKFAIPGRLTLTSSYGAMGDIFQNFKIDRLPYPYILIEHKGFIVLAGESGPEVDGFWLTYLRHYKGNRLNLQNFWFPGFYVADIEFNTDAIDGVRIIQSKAAGSREIGKAQKEDEMGNLMVSTQIIYELCAALTCNNITTERFCSYPRALRRKNNKKKPIFEYHVLTIKPGKSQAGAAQGGTHASPRVHLRRGHRREYKPGSFTWVQPCVVGSKELGIVHKDYAVVSGNAT